MRTANPACLRGSGSACNKHTANNLPERPRVALRDDGKEESMEYNELVNEVPTYQSNIRAEDGMQPRSHRNALYEGVLIPLGAIFALVLTMIGMMRISN